MGEVSLRFQSRFPRDHIHYFLTNNLERFPIPADFSEMLPVKATLIESASQTIFVISMHHITYDGMSVPFLFEDLQRACLGHSAIDRPPFSHAALAIAQTTNYTSAF